MSLTLASSIKQNPAVNLYLEEIGPLQANGFAASYRLIMPDDTGTLPAAYMNRRTGLSLAWPVNPHATGAATLLDALNPGGMYSEAVRGASVICDNHGKDQHGRHFAFSYR
jgi:hypothetical protein